MRRLLRLAVIAAADAAAKFALERKGQKVLNVKLYETGYTFTNRGDKDNEAEIGPDARAVQGSLAVVRQPRRGGRAAHRETAEPVL